MSAGPFALCGSRGRPKFAAIECLKIQGAGTHGMVALAHIDSTGALIACRTGAVSPARPGSGRFPFRDAAGQHQRGKGNGQDLFHACASQKVSVSFAARAGDLRTAELIWAKLYRLP